MKKPTDPEKLRDMVRSILPSTSREGARKGKAFARRVHRRSVRAELHTEDPEETAVDFVRDISMRSLVWWRRSHDKLNHFMRWCESLTEGMPEEEALGYVRSILPKNLIGDHAYGHWEAHVKYRLHRTRYVRSAERSRRVVQSYRDSAIVRLRRALHADPTLHARLNAEIKSRKTPEEPRRMFLGEHDVEAFVDDVRCTKVERNAMFRLIEEIEGRPHGRPSAFRVRRDDRRPRTRAATCVAALPYEPAIIHRWLLKRTPPSAMSCSSSFSLSSAR